MPPYTTTIATMVSSLSSFFVLFALSLLFSLLTIPSHSLTCTSQSSSLKRSYTNCTDLSALNATLHYSYDSTNSSLSIAYTAKPADSGAWISWAINPTSTGMVGAQALMALKTSSGTIVPKTYNISSYQSIVESKLSFDVWDFSAEGMGDTMRIFATVKVPEDAESVNQVWQIGGAVNGGHPSAHPMKPENKKSKGSLQLKLSSSSPALAPGTNNGTAPASDSSGFSSVRVLRNGEIRLVLSFLAGVLVAGVF